MKRMVLRAISLAAIAALAATAAPALDASQAAFERLKSLAGEWEGQTKEGKTAVLKTRLSANGSVLVEDFSVVGEEAMDMMTLYHLDGESLLLTHYCMSGNQPRMRAVPTSASPDVLTFSFVDATNLKSRDEGHMHRVVFRFEDDNHLIQEWTFRRGGEDAFTEVVRYARK